MVYYHWRLIAVQVLLCLLCLESSWADSLVPRNKHSWGRFKPGSWRRVRVFSEDFDENGNVLSSSTKEATSTLLEVDDTTFTLHIEGSVQVAGEKIPSEPQTVKQTFNGEEVGKEIPVNSIGKGVVEINGESIECEIRKMVTNGGASKKTTIIHFSDEQAPYILRRETTYHSTMESTKSASSKVEVVALRMPFRILAETKTVSLVKIVNQHSSGSTETIEAHSTDVPGGVVSHTSNEKDRNGRIIRRSRLELVDFGIGSNDEPVRKRILERLRSKSGRR